MKKILTGFLLTRKETKEKIIETKSPVTKDKIVQVVLDGFTLFGSK